MSQLTVEERPTVETGPSTPEPQPRKRGALRRISEEEYILVVLLARFGLIFLLIFPPAIIVNDSWLTLMVGRELWENGLPSVDEVTVYGLGSTWTDQQWLAQLTIFGAHSLGGLALVLILTAASVVAAFSIAAAPNGAIWVRCCRATTIREAANGPGRP